MEIKKPVYLRTIKTRKIRKMGTKKRTQNY